MTSSQLTESFDPRTGRSTPAPPDSTPVDVDAVVAAATGAAAVVGTTEPAVRDTWLTAVAAALEGDADRLTTVADEETGLGPTRLRGELGRAADALRFYGSVAAEGSWLSATIDHPTAFTPDLRRVNQPLGPVAVFGASNFPFGFGVLGHDTASALAAGSPVVVKAHPAHPRLSFALAEVAQRALTAAGAPHGTFGLVAGFGAGEQLVLHPGVQAVAFTGSQRGGLALWRLAAGRDRPVPVYAEMGTVNTAVATRAAAATRAADLTRGFVASFTLGMGQFCTKPGLLLVPAGFGLPELLAAELEGAAPSGWLLTESISAAYHGGVEELLGAGARPLATAPPAPAGWAASPTLLTVAVADLRPGSALLEECFGPVALVAEYADDDELDAALEVVPTALAAAVHGAGAQDGDVARLVARLAERVGRVVVDAWPTGVAVTWAQQHGGPWPATTAPSATSVGAAALDRFVRPVAYQDVPDSALPQPVQEANPWRVPRRVDGRPE